MTKRVAALVVLCALACSPRPALRTGGNVESLDVTCARALQELDMLIDARAADASVSEDAVLEARALRDAAAELYLEGENGLALDLCDQAFLLLGKGT